MGPPMPSGRGSLFIDSSCQYRLPQPVGVGDSVDDASQRQAVVERLEAMVRDDPRRDDQDPGKLAAALDMMRRLNPETQRLLESELLRSSNLVAEVSVPWVAAGSKGGAAEFVTRYCSASGWLPNTTVGVDVVDARLHDTLALRSLRAAHKGSMYEHVVRRVRNIFGLADSESLVSVAGAKYGTANVFAVLDVALCIAGVQFRKTSRQITADMGRAGADAYADAQDACHYMTAALAEFIMAKSPTPERLAAMMAQGRLAKYGISPSDVDHEVLRSELMKTAGTYPSNHRPPATVPKLPVPDECTVEDGHPCYEITRPPQPVTVGDAMESHLSRRRDVLRRKRTVQLLKIVLPIVAVAVSLWRGGQLLLEPGSWRPLPVLLSLLLVVLLPAVGGYWLAKVSGMLVEVDRNAFFVKARGINHYTVLEGKRDQAFLAALRQLRPKVFAASGGGVPRRFIAFADEQGLMILGQGERPKIVASFHWLHIADIVPDAPGHGLRFHVKHHGLESRLAFEVSQAKVAWTAHSFLENQPLRAMSDSYNGMQVLFQVQANGRSAAELEAEAAAYESRVLPPLYFAGMEYVNKARAAANKTLLIAAALAVGAPFAGRILVP